MEASPSSLVKTEPPPIDSKKLLAIIAEEDHDAQTPGSNSGSSVPVAPTRPAAPSSPGDTRAAAAALLGAAWPSSGRHVAQMALAGALVRGRWTEDEAVDFLCAVCRAAGDEDRTKRGKTVREAMAKAKEDRPYTGFAKLSTLLPVAVVDSARKLLGLSDDIDISSFTAAPVEGAPDDPLNRQYEGVKKVSKHEISFVLSQGTLWRNVFRFNVLSRKHVAVDPPFPMRMTHGFLSVGDIGKIQDYLASLKMAATNEMISSQIAKICESPGHKYNPFEEYLKRLPRSSGYLAHVHRTIFCIEDPLASTLLTKTLVAAVRRALAMPGIGEVVQAVDHQGVLVLSGEQGINKGRLVKILAGEFYHSIDVSRLKDKDTVIKAQGAVLVELEEMSTTGTERDGLKRFLSAADDFERRPFDKDAEKVQRSYAMIATTNEARLEDPTGHRRMWPIILPRGTVIDWEAATALRDALWAEAYALALTSYSHHLTKEEAAQCAERATGLEMEDGDVEMIQDAIAGKEFVTVREVYDHMTKGTKTTEKMPGYISKDIAASLRRLECVSAPRRFGKVLRRVWTVPEAFKDVPISEAGMLYRNQLRSLEAVAELRKN